MHLEHGWFEFAANMLMARRKPRVSVARNSFAFIRMSAKICLEAFVKRTHWHAREKLLKRDRRCDKAKFTCKSPGPRWSALPCWPSSPLYVIFDTCGTLEWTHVTLLPGHMSTYNLDKGERLHVLWEQRRGGWSRSERVPPEPETHQAKDVIHELERNLTQLASAEELLLKCSSKFKFEPGI